jgi:Domain of unknown function (DUF4328)
LCIRCSDILSKSEVTQNHNDANPIPSLEDSLATEEQPKGHLFLQCPKCGSSIHRMDIICAECGQSFDNSSSALESQEIRSTDVQNLQQSENLPAFHSTIPLSKRIKWLLFVTIVLNAAGILFAINHIMELSVISQEELFSRVQSQTSFPILLLLSETQVVFYFAIFILLMAFADQVYTNLNALGITNLRNSHITAIVIFFVPVLNLVYPYTFFTEIYQASDPTISTTSSWKQSVASKTIKQWWLVCFTVITLSLTSAILLTTTDSVRFHSLMIYFILIANILAIPAAILTMKLTYEIGFRQKQKKEKVVHQENILVKETAVTEEEASVLIPFNYWLFVKILKGLATTRNKDENIRKLLKGIIWIASGISLGCMGYFLDNAGFLGLAGIISMYGVMLLVSAYLGLSDRQ